MYSFVKNPSIRPPFFVKIPSSRHPNGSTIGKNMDVHLDFHKNKKLFV